MASPWKRVYTDVPVEVHEKFKILAIQKGVTIKGLLADLMTNAVAQANIKLPRKRKNTNG